MIAYSIIGGMRAVVATDILQFSVLVISIPMALVFGVISVGGIDTLVQSVPLEHISFPGNLSYITVVSLFLSLLLGEALVPPYVQRLFIAKNDQVTQWGTLSSGIMSIPFFICAGAIGLVALALAPNLDSNMALPYVIQNVLPIGLSGLAQAGIIAVVMSSADSYLNAASVAAIHDVYKPLKTSQISAEQELKLMRFATLAIGGFSVLFAYIVIIFGHR
jgi:SSS family solute:Na+ symporter